MAGGGMAHERATSPLDIIFHRMAQEFINAHTVYYRSG
jgi:hypothetical protein